MDEPGESVFLPAAREGKQNLQCSSLSLHYDKIPMRTTFGRKGFSWLTVWGYSLSCKGRHGSNEAALQPGSKEMQYQLISFLSFSGRSAWNGDHIHGVS